MPWVESVFRSFRVRHEEQDAAAVAVALARLDRTRTRLELLFDRSIDEITIVFHAHPLALDLAHPLLPLLRRLDDPAHRRYRVGAVGAERIDVLGPRVLDQRASGAAGSRDMLEHSLDALYARLLVGVSNRGLPPPATPGRLVALHRWAWIAEGAGAFFGGQVEHARFALARRLREGSPPSFPPARADAALLGGTLFDLLAREEGLEAAVALACRVPQRNEQVLIDAFHGRSLRHTEGTWRGHLARLAGAGSLREAMTDPFAS